MIDIILLPFALLNGITGLIVGLIFLFWCMEEDKVLMANFFMFIAAVFIYFTHKEWYIWIYTNPMDTLMYIAAYIAIGSIWSFLHFNFELKKFREEYIAKCSRDTTPEQIAYEIRHYISKNQITFWIMYWPISLMWSMIDDVVFNIGNHLHGLWKNFFTAIEDRHIKKAQEDLKNKTTMRTTR